MIDIVSLQNEDGSFSGDIWGEVDTRYFSWDHFWLLSVYELTVLRLKSTDLFVLDSLILLFAVYQYYVAWIKSMWGRLWSTLLVAKTWMVVLVAHLVGNLMLAKVRYILLSLLKYYSLYVTQCVYIYSLWRFFLYFLSTWTECKAVLIYSSKLWTQASVLSSYTAH